MRRHLGRVTGVKWMAKHREYALEVERMAEASPQADLRERAGKLAALPTAPAPAGATAPRRPQQSVDSLR